MIRTKDVIYEVINTATYCGKKFYYVGDEMVIPDDKVTKEADTVAELCDCFIIKYVESHYYSIYYTYDDAKYVYGHDKQNTTCILYGVIDTETGLKYVAKETDKGLKEI